jgi:YfiH family protein
MHRVAAFVTTRHGGSSVAPYASLNLGGGVGDDPGAVRANRVAVAGRAGLAPDRLVFMNQVHSRIVHPVVPGEPVPSGIDGVATAHRGVGLAVLVADCVPMLARDPQAGVIAATHAGRQGAAAGIAIATIEAMEALGACRDRISVLLGPAVCGRCYEVPAGMRADVDANLPGSADETSWGTASLDLRRGMARQLAAAGVTSVVLDPACTIEDHQYFSHRREGVTGRFAGVIWMPGPDR